MERGQERDETVKSVEECEEQYHAVGVLHHQGFGVLHQLKLQTLVYDILPSTTAVFSYAIGSSKLSANEQFFLFCWCSNSSKFVTNNSDKTRRVISSR